MGCDGVKLLNLPIADNARQVYEFANGRQIEIIETNAVNPIRAQAIPNGDIFELPLVMGCTLSLDIMSEAGTDASFWLAQPLYITYDADNNRCGTNFTCDWQASMNGDIAEINTQCQ